MRTYVDLSTTGAVGCRGGRRGAGDARRRRSRRAGQRRRGRRRGTDARGDGRRRRADVFERVRPLLELFGKNVFLVGATPGQGQTAKLLNNLLSATALAITSEAVTFGITAGLDPATLLDVFNAGTGRNTATATKFPEHVLTRRFASEFRLELMAKDLELCIGEARARRFRCRSASSCRALDAGRGAGRPERRPHGDHPVLRAAVGRRGRGERGRRRMSYEIHAVRYATLRSRRSELFYRYSSYGEPDAEIEMAYYFWALRRGGRDDPGRHGVRSGGRRASRANVPRATCRCRARARDRHRESVSTVVVTHFHYDHIGNLDAFPQAQLIVPATELEFWTGPMAERYQFGSHVEQREIALRRAGRS